jgi:signal transduction histidine kinase/CheY-like chemotaxis protein
VATERDLPRLNVLLEFLADCAQADDHESLLRVAAGKVRWIVPFERCTLALIADGKLSYWCVTREQEAMLPMAAESLAPGHVAAIRRSVERNLPVVEGTPAHLICHPLQSGARTLGALCISENSERYSFQDVRFAQHIAQHVGTTAGRLQYEAVQRESRAKDEFLALLSHELRNPLAPILASVHILKLKGERVQPDLGVIERQAQHLVRLVDDLLDVARLTRGKVTLRKASTGIAPVVAAAIESCYPLFDERQHSVAVDDACPGAQVHADADRLQQVFVNLLGNAARYTPPGGRIRVRIRRDPAGVAVEIADNGVGIPPGTLPRIFDSFFQGELARGRKGLGLGLAIAKSLVLLHDGSIDAASVVGQGSVFTVTLPEMHEAAVPPAAPQAGAGQAGSPVVSQQILVVDDNRDAADTIAQVLRLGGHDVRTSYDGAGALELCKRFQPSVAILDISMPGMDGHELARALATLLAGRPPYLIALSGLGRENDRERGSKSGFREYLVKPVEAATVLERVALIGSEAAEKPS